MERDGKWTNEEEEYASKLIDLFLAGQLESDIKEGDTLRQYLSEKLHCKETRITRKFGQSQPLASQYQQNKNDKEMKADDRQLLEKLKESYALKDKKVQLSRKKRKKYLKGPTLCEKKQRTDNNDLDESASKNNEEIDFFAFDWDEDNILSDS
mmetsp:Transcript_33411/g.34046  ORF Transcript_33411/g.34046 Transcript_33411/m.34046 type:complete len:153 (+) Transcript_33411:130-588(+)